MAFQLKPHESVRDGITRNVSHELERVLEYLGSKGPTREHGVVRQSEIVHESRKSFKKVRAALRLVREDLGDEVYREENWSFRDAARPLTLARDAVALVETAEKLAPQLAGQIESGASANLRSALLQNQQAVTRRVLEEDKALVAVKEFTTRALAGLAAWKIERDGWEAVESGVRRVYRAGHRALARAGERPSVENLHEWRKQAKYLWHVLQLLEPAWTGSEKDLADRTHELSRLLGDDHDLAVLRSTLAADPLAYGGHLVLKRVFTIVDRERQQLEGEAFALGRVLYADAPKIFTSRMAGYWKAWAPDLSAAKHAAGEPEPRPRRSPVVRH